MDDRARPHLVMLLTEDWFFLSHFSERAVAAQAAGFRVTVLARDNGQADKIRSLGLEFRELRMRRRGLNPIRELRACLAILRAYRSLGPTLLYHAGLKPVLYGTLAARLAGIRSVVNAPTGMGFVFTNEGMMARLLRAPVRLSLKFLLNPRGSRVIFENADDLESLVGGGIVRRSEAVLIRGAGVDIDAIRPAPKPERAPVTVLVARMLWDKGVGDFVEAARRLKAGGSVARFLLVGAPDPDNPSVVPETTLRAWTSEGVVEWLGHQDDVAAILEGADIACLPSYREGLPKSLLEAMAAGLPIVTTDVPGCREAVRHGHNGLLVPVRNPAALADALQQLIDGRGLRNKLGNAGRHRAEKEFASSVIVAKTLAVYRSLAGITEPPPP